MRPGIALLIPVLLACSTGEDLFGEGARRTQTTGTGGRGSGGEGGRSATSSGNGMNGTRSASTGTEESSSTGEDICKPKDDDTPYTKCAKVSCCPQLTQCENDENCSCWVECYDDGHGFFDCQNKCGLQGATFAMLEACVSGPCLLDCT